MQAFSHQIACPVCGDIRCLHCDPLCSADASCHDDAPPAAAPGGLMGTPEVEPWVGTAEAAAILGVSKQRVGQLALLPDFPEPVVRLRATPVWRTADITAYEAARRDRADVRRYPRRPPAAPLDGDTE